MTIPKINHDGMLDVATGRHRRETNWKNKQISWSELVKRLSETHRTAETHAEYMAAKKPRQDEIKDIGGFVGGLLANGKRKNGSVVHRQLITLDLDFAKVDCWEDTIQLIYDNAACIYSTHKHSPDNPRLRLIMPLSREVMADEYVAICRRVAGNIGIEDFDPTGFRPTQLMYWPSTPKDGEFIFKCQDGKWLDADEVLRSYHDWRDASEWPMSAREKEIPLRAIKKQGDPLEKTGIVGAFCRTYNIHEAIEKFLPDVYKECGVDGRYSYDQGSTAAGLVVYEDKYAFSHHGTDPISGKLCNSFDLVRLHKFGLKDEDVRENTAINKLPSYTDMVAFAAKDPEVRKQIGIEKLADAEEDFKDFADEQQELTQPEDNAWLADMGADKKGNYHSTINNVLLILRNDPKLKGRFRFDLFDHREIAVKNLPWRKVTHETRFLVDSDDAALRHYIETTYDISGEKKISDAMQVHMLHNSFHPIKEYLESLVWDGEERAETIFIDYLGAEDSEYTRMAARKWLAAAVTRIYKPGCKFDYTPIVLGEQGEKKSMLPDKLGGPWYSDSFSTVHNKEAFEQLQGAWIIEIPELSGFKKADSEAVKHYLSKRKDRYRVSYGRRVEDFPRQSVFIGTGNINDFIKDPTGGRRFWPVKTYDQQPEKDVAKMDEYERGQIWAEAVTFYKNGEKLYFDKELESVAKEIQLSHSEDDPKTGIVLDYLETALPEKWEQMDIYQRRDWLRDCKNDEAIQDAGIVQRDRVCVAELWCEVLGNQAKDMTKFSIKDLHEIMRKAKGWKLYKGKLRFGIYGIQRGYVRTEMRDVSHSGKPVAVKNSRQRTATKT